MRRILIVVILLFPSPAFANLLRNGEFQDDWITMLPETKNHHWCFPSEFFNRRDYNPDGWYCKGSWDWQNADGPWGERRMVVTGPAALATMVTKPAQTPTAAVAICCTRVRWRAFGSVRHPLARS